MMTCQTFAKLLTACILTLCPLAIAGCGGDGSTNTSTGPDDDSGEAQTDILPGMYTSVSAPRFNHKGTLIAMLAQTKDGEEHVVLTDRRGDLERVIVTQGVGYLTTFAWSADDETLYFSGSEGISRVPSGTPMGTPEVVLKGFAISGFDISLDGTQIAWSVNGQQDVSLGALDAQGLQDSGVSAQRIPGRAPRFSPDGTRVLHITGEAFAIAQTKDFNESAVMQLDGMASYLANGAWRDDGTVVLLIDDAIVSRTIDPVVSTTLREQFAVTGLDVDASGHYIYHVNGGKELTLVERP